MPEYATIEQLRAVAEAGKIAYNIANYKTAEIAPKIASVATGIGTAITAFVAFGWYDNRHPISYGAVLLGSVILSLLFIGSTAKAIRASERTKAEEKMLEDIMNSGPYRSLNDSETNF